MTQLEWQEVAEGAQRRAEQRCAVEGHAWEQLDGMHSCRWCLAISESEPEAQTNWRFLALSHAAVVRALLAVKDLEPTSAGAGWLADAKATLALAGERRVEVKSR